MFAKNTVIIIIIYILTSIFPCLCRLDSSPQSNTSTPLCPVSTPVSDPMNIGPVLHIHSTSSCSCLYTWHQPPWSLCNLTSSLLHPYARDVKIYPQMLIQFNTWSPMLELHTTHPSDHHPFCSLQPLHVLCLCWPTFTAIDHHSLYTGFVHLPFNFQGCSSGGQDWNQFSEFRLCTSHSHTRGLLSSTCCFNHVVQVPELFNTFQL